MGSRFSAATVPDTDPEIEARALADATGFRLVEGITCHYGSLQSSLDAGKAFGIPGYAFKFQDYDPVRVPGIGYGYKTHRFVGKPIDCNCSTSNWIEPNLQDNCTYYIVRLTWPSNHEYWVKGTHVQDIDWNRVVKSVEIVEEYDPELLEVMFTLHPDTLVTNTYDQVQPLKYFQPADQAAINFTFAKQCIPK